MKKLRLLDRVLTTARQDARLVQVACLVAAAAVLPLGLMGAVRLSDTNGELLIAVLASGILSLQFLLVGLAWEQAGRRSAG